MGTILGLVIGVLATVIVGHYYYKRTITKRLSVYRLFDNRIFAGIDDAVREQLKFLYRGEEVSDLQQCHFIVANDGERAVRDYIEPLTLTLPKEASILDAVVLHRRPSELAVTVTHTTDDKGLSRLTCNFPLLNKNDFFVIKVLIRGAVKISDLTFHMLCEDLPRTLRAQWLPPSSTVKPQKKVEWIGLVVGISFLIPTITTLFCLYLLRQHIPSIFFYPWATAKPLSIEFWCFLVSAIGSFFCLLIAAVMIFGMGLEDVLARQPRFPIPRELHKHSRGIVTDDELEKMSSSEK